MCGIWFLSTKKQLPLEKILLSAKSIEHRGQDGYGSYVDFGDYFRVEKKASELIDLPSEGDAKTLIVNFRYATVGADKLTNFPPVIYVGKHNIIKTNVSANDVLLTFHNGEFKVDIQKQELLNEGFNIKATNDTAVVACYVQKNLLNGMNLFDASIDALKRFSGAYSIIFTRNGESVIARDSFGTRNACLYISDHLNTIMLSSETQSFYYIDPFYHEKQMKKHPYSPGFRDLFPGEVIQVKDCKITKAALIHKEDLLWIK